MTAMNTTRVPAGPAMPRNIFEVLSLFRKLRRDMLGTMADWQHTYGDVVNLGGQFNLINPDDIHEVLVTQATKFNKDDGYKNPKTGLARFLGSGLLTSDGEFWKRQRRLAAPAFHAKRIGAYAQTMVDYTQNMLNGWHDGARLDISHEMKQLTMLIVAKTLFNMDVAGDVEPVSEAVNTMQDLSGPVSPLPSWLPTPAKARGKRARRDLDAIVFRMIEEWRVKGEDRGDLMSMLLLAEDEDGSRMSDAQARDEVVTIFLAGHETTATTLNWTWVLLSQNPEVEGRLHHELDTVLHGQPPTLADLGRLPYTTMVIKESMRLYPPAWIIGREALEDVQIGEYTYPKGSNLGILTYLVHHDPRWFPEPERFDPERFSIENEPNIPRYAYMPFGGGPRICIGNQFAQMEAALLLATIASRYTLQLPPGHKVEMRPMLTLNVKGDLPMFIHKRTPASQPQKAEAVLEAV